MSSSKGWAAIRAKKGPLLRAPKLLPYLPRLSPLLPQLSPPLQQRIVDSVERLGPHVPVFVMELSRLLPYLEPLLDELAYLDAPALAQIVAQREDLIGHLDHIVPHLPALRPHHARLAAALGVIGPYVGRLAPHLAALLPHLGPLLTSLRSMEAAHIDELTSPTALATLLPVVGTLAPHLPSLAPHLPALLRRFEQAELSALLPALLAALPTVAARAGTLVAAIDELSLTGSLPRLLSAPDALLAELERRDREREAAAPAAARDGDGDGDGDGWSNLFGLLRFFGDDGESEGREAQAKNSWQQRAPLVTNTAAASRREAGDAASDAAPLTLEEEEAALSEVNRAMAAVSTRMDSLDEAFRHANSAVLRGAQKGREEAELFMRWESSLIETEQGIAELTGQTRERDLALQKAEKKCGMHQLNKGREARIQSQFDRGAPLIQPGGAPRQRRISRVEDHVLLQLPL